MKVFREYQTVVQHLNTLRKQDKRIGLVPTMGALHKGHFSLLENARKDCDVVVASIYVNPTQFNNPEDLKHYPRTEAEDLQLLEQYNCDVVFIPDDSIYVSEPKLRFDFGKLESLMEGANRPGHFNGVALIVSKLFHIINPHYAYFGKKDLQQLHIIKLLVHDLSFPVNIVPIDTVREADGLAFSSRNARLNDEERKISVILHRALTKGQSMLLAGESIQNVKKEINKMFNQGGAKLEYYEIVDHSTLMPLQQISTTDHVSICVAAYLGEVRLIDNLTFEV